MGALEIPFGSAQSPALLSARHVQCVIARIMRDLLCALCGTAETPNSVTDSYCGKIVKENFVQEGVYL